MRASFERILALCCLACVATALAAVLVPLHAQAGEGAQGRRYGFSTEGEGWYAMWEASVGDSSQYLDYDVEPALLYGVSLSGFYRTPGRAWLGFRVDYLSDFQQSHITDAFGEDVEKTSEVITGAILLNFGRKFHFYSKVLYGSFTGVLDFGERLAWQTDWTLADLLWVHPPSEDSKSDLWYGFGFRMLGYDQPMEIVTYRESVEVGRQVGEVEHRGYCILLKAMDGSHFGISDPGKLWYGEGGLGMGLAVDKLKSPEDNLYGVVFTFDLDVGLKKVFPLGPVSLGGRIGYRILGDLFILSEYEKGDGDNRTATEINIFHGIFASVTLAM